MRNILFGLMICLFPLYSAAQEHAEYNHYVIYPSLINPGAITKENLHSVFVNYRTHWSGFDNNQNLITLQYEGCLLYTSDAADERSSVDLGGRRIIKKKKKIIQKTNKKKNKKHKKNKKNKNRTKRNKGDK